MDVCPLRLLADFMTIWADEVSKFVSYPLLQGDKPIHYTPHHPLHGLFFAALADSCAPDYYAPWEKFEWNSQLQSFQSLLLDVVNSNLL